MLHDPGIDPHEIFAALRDGYGIDASRLTFVRSYDLDAASYELDGSWFVKVRFGPVNEVSLEVPRALLDAGVSNILAPIPTLTGGLWAPMDGRSLVVYPFVPGRTAMATGMTGDQWRAFGRTLRAVHESGLERSFADRLPAETFAIPSAASVREVLELAERPPMSPAPRRLAAVLEERRPRIEAILARAEELGGRLRDRPLRRVLCHADIHAANIVVAEYGEIMLVDWDGPMIAPRERDLLFVIGSRIARRVEPHEEAWFFEGYGQADVDPEAIVYYRYERVLEDIAVDAASVFTDPAVPEATREGQVDMIAGFFGPGDVLESAEEVRVGA